MRRLFALPLLAAVTVAAGALVRSAGAEDSDRTKTVAEKNVRLTIPAEWTWDEVSDDDKEAGFVLLARRTVKPGVSEASARVRVVSTGGATLESLMEQIKEAKSSGLKDVTGDVNSLEWAGVVGSKLILSGQFENGASIAFEVYGAIVGDQFHQLDIRCTNGAEEKIREDLNDLALGYSFLKGGGKPAATDEGAAQEGLTRKFPNLDLQWTLPKPWQVPAKKEGEEPTEARFGWDADSDANPDRKVGEEGLLARAHIEAGGGRPVSLRLFIQKEQPGNDPAGIVKFERNFENMIQNNFSDRPAPKVDEEAQLGNATGASCSWNGKDKSDPPRPLYMKVWFVALQGALYQVLLVGLEDAEKTFRTQIAEALKGLQWGSVKSGVRGPWVAPFATFTAVRPDAIDAGRETKVLGAVELTKPASFGKLKFDATVQGMESWVFAAEARAGDDAYAFVGIRKFDWKGFTDARPPRPLESVIDEHVIAWNDTLTDPVTVPKGSKVNKKADTFATLKGWSYEFRGTKEKQPFLERGWVVKTSQNVYWIRLQYGGKGETALAKDAQALVKSIRIQK